MKPEHTERNKRLRAKRPGTSDSLSVKTELIFQTMYSEFPIKLSPVAVETDRHTSLCVFVYLLCISLYKEVFGKCLQFEDQGLARSTSSLKTR